MSCKVTARRRLTRARALLVSAVTLLGLFACQEAALAAGPPQIVLTAVEGVQATAVTLRASIVPNGLATTYHFEYLTQAAYEANLDAGREPFAGASLEPVPDAGLGVGTAPVKVNRNPIGLIPSTAYRYRVKATNSAETVFSVARPFATQDPTNAFSLLDGRGWELVSPIGRNGGSVQRPGEVAGGGVFQAAAGGDSITYSLADSFSDSAAGAPVGSQYVSTRQPSAWATADLTTPLLSGSYGDDPKGVPYQLFSPDLSRALMSNGQRCRGDVGGECPVANSPLPGSGAPAGYRNYYLRGTQGFHALLSAADLAHTSLSASQFEMRLVGASPDLSHSILSSCAALVAGAVEVSTSEGCEDGAQNLYEWSSSELSAINLLPGETQSVPGASIAASAGAVSIDGSRVYWTREGTLYLREGGATKLLDAEASFQAASADGAVAFFLKAGHLYRYLALSGNSTDLTPGGEVEGVLGASADGSRVYYATPAGVLLWDGGTTTSVAEEVTASSFPPATGTARVSPDGSNLLFLSAAELTGYPSEGRTEAFLYSLPVAGGEPHLTCVSCNPTGERPKGSASIPGAYLNATTNLPYKPRSLSANGHRVFFNSTDSLVAQDSNEQHLDVYEWEAVGTGSCVRVGGCVNLISSGRDPEASSFLDASTSGDDAFFFTAASLYPSDPGAVDIYDARVGGGFSLPPNVIACNADACQVLPEAPEDPTPGTLIPTGGNPPLTIMGAKKKKPKPKHSGHKKKKKKHRQASKR